MTNFKQHQFWKRCRQCMRGEESKTQLSPDFQGVIPFDENSGPLQLEKCPKEQNEQNSFKSKVQTKLQFHEKIFNQEVFYLANFSYQQRKDCHGARRSPDRDKRQHHSLLINWPVWSVRFSWTREDQKSRYHHEEVPQCGEGAHNWTGEPRPQRWGAEQPWRRLTSPPVHKVTCLLCPLWTFHISENDVKIKAVTTFCKGFKWAQLIKFPLGLREDLRSLGATRATGALSKCLITTPPTRENLALVKWFHPI